MDADRVSRSIIPSKSALGLRAVRVVIASPLSLLKIGERISSRDESVILYEW